MRYNKGDKVRVRDDLQALKAYGGTSATAQMAEFKGKTVVISNVLVKGNGKIVYNVEGGGGFWWTNEMFTNKSYTPDELFDALLRGAIDEETYEVLLEVKETWK